MAMKLDATGHEFGDPAGGSLLSRSVIYNGAGGIFYLKGPADVALPFKATPRYSNLNFSLASSALSLGSPHTRMHYIFTSGLLRAISPAKTGFGGPCVVLSCSPNDPSGVTIVFFQASPLPTLKKALASVASVDDLVSHISDPFGGHLLGFLFSSNFPPVANYKNDEVVMYTGRVA
jgi:hypothetical protein